ncbi:MAG: phage tail tape measure protein [Pseudomonadota bacterium]
MAQRLTMLIARLKDEMSGPAAKAGSSLGKLAASSKQLDKLAGATGEVNDLTKALQRLGSGAGALGGASEEARRLAHELANLESKAGKISAFRDFQKSFSAARTTFRAAQKEVERLGREMAKAEKPTVELRKAYSRAQAEVRSASAAFERQKAAFLGASRALREAGTPISEIASAERNLQTRIESTTGALRRQIEVLKRHPHSLGLGAGRQGPGFQPAPGGALGKPGQGGGGVGRGALAVAGVGGAVLAGVGVPLLGAAAVGAGAKYAFDSSMGFERVMTDVQRATDVGDEELSGLAQRIMDLARATGTSKEELAGLMAAGGFAGRPKGELPAFTEYAAKAARAWGIGAGDTGQALAEIGNMFDADQPRMQEIGDAVNAIADQTASSESDLLDVLSSSGQSGRQSGFSAEQTLAFAAAQKSVGVGNEVASSTFNTLMNAMALGRNFLKDSADGYKALGLKPEQVQKNFASKPLETTLGLLQKINAIKDPIKKAETITNLFGKEYQDNIATLAGQYENLIKTLDGVGEKSKYVGSVQKDFEKQLEKDFSKYDRAWQSVDVLMTKGGDYVKSMVGGVSDGIINTVDNWERAPQAIDDQREKEDALLALRQELRDRLETARVLTPYLASSLETRLLDVEERAAEIEARRRGGAAVSTPGLFWGDKDYPGGRSPAFGDYRHPERLSEVPNELVSKTGVPPAWMLGASDTSYRSFSAPPASFASPPGAGGPTVDYAQIQADAEKAGQEIAGALSVTASPQIDTRPLVAALDLARELNRELARTGTLAAQAEAAGRSRAPAGWNARGTFTDGVY